MKPFCLFPAFATLMFCLLVFAPKAAFAQDPAELKAELQGYGFENSEEVLDWLLKSDHEGPFHMVNLLKFHREANHPFVSMRFALKSILQILAFVPLRSLVRGAESAPIHFQK